MTVIAFDVGEFTRWKKIEGQKETVFFTPLGIGVVIKNGNEEDFKLNYHNVRKNLIKKFTVPTKPACLFSQYSVEGNRACKSYKIL